jgi:aspartate/methionine/tyrosine aminotransferase
VFSARTDWNLTENRLSQALAKRRAAGHDVIDLTESNPTRAGFAYDEAAIRAALSDARVLDYAPHPRGLLEARRAVADYYGGKVDPEHVVLTASTSEAYSFLFKLLCDPGDTVLVPRPSYPLFEFLATLDSVRVRHYPLVFEGRWHIDLDALAAACTDDVRAIVVVSPNNPTGSFLCAPELSALRALGRPLICDEVFADYAATEDPARIQTVAGETKLLAFALSGLSKPAALPQMKLGWIAASGPAAARSAALARLEVIADTYLSAGTPVQLAASRLLALAPAMQRQIRDRCAENRAALSAALGPDSPAEVLPADGGWYAVLRLPRTRSEEQWTLELLADDVWVHPGYFFDFPEEAYIIVSLLPRADRFAQAVTRLARRASL